MLLPIILIGDGDCTANLCNLSVPDAFNAILWDLCILATLSKLINTEDKMGVYQADASLMLYRALGNTLIEHAPEAVQGTIY